MDITGTIKVMFDEVTFESGFNKREFVVTTIGDRYPQDIKFEVVKDNVPKLAEYGVGDTVKVEFDLRGNEYNEKYYVNLVAWRLETADGAASADAPPMQPSIGEPDPSNALPF